MIAFHGLDLSGARWRASSPRNEESPPRALSLVTDSDFGRDEADRRRDRAEPVVCSANAAPGLDQAQCPHESVPPSPGSPA